MEVETALDKDLHDDMLKLVRYKILFVKGDHEHAFPEAEELVADNMDGSAFTAWKIAEFIQNLQPPKDDKDKDKERTRVPKKWADKHYPGPPHDSNGVLTGLPAGDKKYLRVYYEVLDRYPREKFKYEEQQIRVLNRYATASPPALGHRLRHRFPLGRQRRRTLPRRHRLTPAPRRRLTLAWQHRLSLARRHHPPRPRRHRLSLEGARPVPGKAPRPVPGTGKAEGAVKC